MEAGWTVDVLQKLWVPEDDYLTYVSWAEDDIFLWFIKETRKKVKDHYAGISKGTKPAPPRNEWEGIKPFRNRTKYLQWDRILIITFTMLWRALTASSGPSCTYTSGSRPSCGWITNVKVISGWARLSTRFLYKSKSPFFATVIVTCAAPLWWTKGLLWLLESGTE